MDNRRGAQAPTLTEIAEIVGGALHVPDSASQHSRVTGVCSDTRRLDADNLFVAIKGERFDGHQFVHEAVRAGGSASLVSAAWHEGLSPLDASPGALIVVPEVLTALQTLAQWHRDRFDLPVIAVTGSNGKTTTKDMIAEVLGQRFRVFKTPGNLNSQLGVSESLFKLGKEHEAAVFELGMNRAGELDRLARMVGPVVGVITNVGPAHIEFFESIEGIARAKGEILDHLPSGGKAVLNADDHRVMAERGRSRAPIITFGRGSKADVRLAAARTDLSGSSFTLADGSEFRIGLMGEHQVMNALAAVAVARIFEIPDEATFHALDGMTPAAMRMEYRRLGGIHLVNDAYNANPSSMKAALSALSTTRGRKLAVLGDMLELGEATATAHREIGMRAAKVADVIITVGERARVIAESAMKEGLPPGRVVACATNEEAAAAVLANVRDGDVILVKGSRGMRMEAIVETMESTFREPVEG